MRTFPLYLFIFFAAAAAGCTAQHPVNLAAEEAAIRATDANWLAAVKAHDLQHALPFWTDDATILPPGMPAISGKEAIGKFLSGMFATPGFSVTWQPEKVEVSRSGDLAYSTEISRISFTTPEGKTATEDGKGAVVWKKQSDGSWKAILDFWNSSAPAGAK